VSVGAVELAESDALGWRDKSAARLEEKPDLVDYSHVRLVVMVQLRIAANFIQVLLIVDGSADDLARVRDRTQKLNGAQWHCGGARGKRTDSIRNFVEVCDQYIVCGKRIA